MQQTLEKGDRWSRDLWARAAERWSGRAQDLTYRECVSRRAWREFLRTTGIAGRSIRALDSGCGDGSETLFFRQEMEELDCSGILYAHEPQQSSVAVARERVVQDVGHHTVSISILPALSELGYGCVDVLLSSYVLHDVADVEAYVGDVAALVCPGGNAGFMIVHPSFVEAMVHKGVVRTCAELDAPGKNWVLACEYPIVEVAGTFYVPLFHRTELWYMQLLGKLFSRVVVRSLRVAPEVVQYHNNCLPFCDSPLNVHYPEIVMMDSSMLFVCTK